MTSDTETELVFHRMKRKFIVGLVVSVGLLCAAVAVWWVADKQQEYKPSHLKAAAIIAACFLTFYGAYNIWELRDQTPALVIDREGIIDNMGGTPMGRIPWDDVTGSRIVEVLGSQFVVIDVVDHQKYLDRFGTRQSIAKLATELAGSPVNFTAEPIGLTAEELLRVLSDAFHKYGVAPVHPEKSARG